MGRQAKQILDLRRYIPPLSLLKLTETFRHMRSNGVLEIMGQDPDTWTDLFKVLPSGSYELVGVQGKIENGDGYKVTIRKK